MDQSPLAEHIQLAINLHYMSSPQGQNVTKFETLATGLSDYLARHGFTHVISQAQRFDDAVKNLSRRQMNNMSEFLDGIPEADAKLLRQTLVPVVDALLSHAGERQMIVLNSSVVSDRLRTLPQSVPLNDRHQLLQHEVVRCLECGAYRSAIVMSWNLAFDFIRTWIHDDATRLGAFNAVLTTKKQSKKGNPLHTAITDYADFFSLKESSVLQWALEAQLFNDKVQRALIEWLDRRNDYAHASFKHPEPEQAMGRIVDLLDVIEAPPFV